MKELFKEYLSKIDMMKTITGLAILAIFGIMILFLITKELPEANREAVIHVLGIIEGAVMAIVSFYYGSSKGSQKKQEIIENITDKK